MFESINNAIYAAYMKNQTKGAVSTALVAVASMAAAVWSSKLPLIGGVLAVICLIICLVCVIFLAMMLWAWQVEAMLKSIAKEEDEGV